MHVKVEKFLKKYFKILCLQKMKTMVYDLKAQLLKNQ